MPTITQAQAKALKSGFLDGFGVDRDSALASPQLNTVEAMMALYAQEFIILANKVLEAQSKNNTGKLGDSIEFQIETFGTSFNMKLLALDYYEYVDLGVQGRSPQHNINRTSPFKYGSSSKASTPTHAQAILKWLKEGKPKSTVSDIKSYGTYGNTEKKSRTQQNADLATAKRIAFFVKRKGLKRTGFWTDSFEKVFADFAVQMSKALGADIQVDLNNLVKGLKKKR